VGVSALWIAGQQDGAAIIDRVMLGTFGRSNALTGPNPSVLFGIWGDTSGNISAVGHQDVSNPFYAEDSANGGVGWDASTAVTIHTPYAIWSPGPGQRMFAAADRQSPILYRDPPAVGWATVAGLPLNVDLRAVWGSSGSDIWAVGLGGVMLHFDGMSWTPVSSVTPQDLTSIWGSSASDIWAVGPKVILHCH
jgi:hypothetical protein